MSLAQVPHRLQLPASLNDQLQEFRRRVWTVKIAEALCGAAFGILVSFLLLFVLDRLWETPAWLRITIFLVAAAGFAVVPLYLHHWVWRNRRWEQLARLLTRKHPQIGDQLLGIIELVRSDDDPNRSLALCEAAIVQVAQESQRRDFRDAVPHPRHRLAAWSAGTAAVVAAGLLAVCPAAAVNAWARLLQPWNNIPRYTFAAAERLPDELVVAHGEPFTVQVQLHEGSIWHPQQGAVRWNGQRPVAATLRNGGYAFEMPPQIEAGRLEVRIGDFQQRIRVTPTLRPELTSLGAKVTLPAYLGRKQPLKKDVRGGSIALVKGSRVQFAATASRNLASASVDGRPQPPRGDTVTTASTLVNAPRKLEFEWRDQFGLAAKEPFSLAITARDDEAPSVSCENLPRQQVVLDSESLNFTVKAQDDFGVRRVGLEWEGFGEDVAQPAKGERVLGAGGHAKENLEVGGTFSATSLGIEAQPLHVRMFVEDYLPGRERVYSATHTLYVLTPEQHAIWLTAQLGKWHRQSLEVRDREMQLHETNKQLRGMAAEEINKPATRRRIENQSLAEKANGRRLSTLVTSGEDLIRQAMRNPEFGVGHLDKWADMLQILKDISSNRMPNVADLLKQASQAPSLASSKSTSKTAPGVGQVRAARSGAGSKPDDKNQKPNPPVPTVADMESSQQPADPKAKPQQGSKSNSKPSLGLPQTTLLASGGGNQSCPAGQKMDEAVDKQKDLLAEFEKIADELNRILANLEGSTFIKRLKAASRSQNRIAGRIGDQLSGAFGVSPTGVKEEGRKLFRDLSLQEHKGSDEVSVIMDDMFSYFERRPFLKFKNVLDDMKKQDVVGNLRQLGDDLPKEAGLSMAQCEYWSDTLDRWAEDLVDPASGGT